MSCMMSPMTDVLAARAGTTDATWADVQVPGFVAESAVVDMAERSDLSEVVDMAEVGRCLVIEAERGRDRD